MVPASDPTSDPRWWAVVVGLALATAAWASAHVVMRIDLPGPRSVPVHLLGTLLGAAGTAAALMVVLARRSVLVRSLGVGLLGLVLMAVAAVWPLLPQHRFAGPVVADLSRSHGVHAGDPLLVVPLGVGVWLVWRAVVAIRVLAIGARGR